MQWNGRSRHLMALQITREKVGIALTDTIVTEKNIQKLDPIPYLTTSCDHGLKEQNRRVGEEFERIMKKYDICGFVVGWPLEPSGSPGASCGRVLHLLDFLAEKKNRILSQGRPMALWDERIFTHNQFQEVQMPTDSWGRSARYCQQYSQETSQGPAGDFRFASKFLEHPVSKDSTSASLILKQFLDTHWKDDIETESHFDESNNFIDEGIESQMNTSL